MKEIECRFLEINKEALIDKLKSLGAEDLGEELLKETIIYDPELKWRDEQRFIRIRQVGEKIYLTYKHHKNPGIDGTYEVELEIDNYNNAEEIFSRIGFPAFRHQEKRRHTLKFNGVTFDFDTWPNVPTYVEVEGKSEEEIRNAVDMVDLDWSKANFYNARWVLENVYKIPFSDLKWFTFGKVE